METVRINVASRWQHFLKIYQPLSQIQYHLLTQHIICQCLIQVIFQMKILRLIIEPKVKLLLKKSQKLAIKPQKETSKKFSFIIKIEIQNNEKN